APANAIWPRSAAPTTKPNKPGAGGSNNPSPASWSGGSHTAAATARNRPYTPPDTQHVSEQEVALAGTRASGAAVIAQKGLPKGLQKGLLSRRHGRRSAGSPQHQVRGIDGADEVARLGGQPGEDDVDASQPGPVQQGLFVGDPLPSRREHRVSGLAGS